MGSASKKTVLWGIVLAFLVAGCRPQASPTKSNTSKAVQWQLEKSFGAGPVSLILRLDKTELELSETLRLEQELRVDPGFESEFPEYLPEDFEGFTVVRIERDDVAKGTYRTDSTGDGTAPKASSEKRAFKKTLFLEPDQSGELTVAPLAVYFHEQGKPTEHHFLTEEIPIKVQAVGDLASLEVLPPRDILEAPPAAQKPSRAWWISGGVAGLLAAWLVWRRLRRRQKTAPPPIPAHEIAWESLRRLVAQNFIERGQVELFFVHLSGIVRAYIENRFQLHAPERTTEEFLEEASRAPALAVYREQLGEFLLFSDRVKFARFQPETADVQAAFDAVKRFITETAADSAHDGAEVSVEHPTTVSSQPHQDQQV